MTMKVMYELPYKEHANKIKKTSGTGCSVFAYRYRLAPEHYKIPLCRAVTIKEIYLSL
jgi:hypothetical protein